MASYLWGQVEDISFLETSCKLGSPKDKNKIVEVEEPAELSAQPLEFQNSSLLKNTDPSETNHKFVDEVTPRYEENTNVEGSSAKTDSYLVEVKLTSTKISFLCTYFFPTGTFSLFLNSVFLSSMWVDPCSHVCETGHGNLWC